MPRKGKDAPFGKTVQFVKNDKKAQRKTAAAQARYQRLDQQLGVIPKAPVRFKKNGVGRPPGQQNYTNAMTREAIIEGLSACGGKRKDLVGFVIRATEDNLKNGVAMLGMITTRMIDAHVTRTEVTYHTLAELDAELTRHGLPQSGEVFRLDYKGSRVVDSNEVAPIDNATEDK